MRTITIVLCTLCMVGIIASWGNFDAMLNITALCFIFLYVLLRRNLKKPIFSSEVDSIAGRFVLVFCYVVFNFFVLRSAVVVGKEKVLHAALWVPLTTFFLIREWRVFIFSDSGKKVNDD